MTEISVDQPQGWTVQKDGNNTHFTNQEETYKITVNEEQSREEWNMTLKPRGGEQEDWTMQPTSRGFKVTDADEIAEALEVSMRELDETDDPTELSWVNSG